MRINSMLCQMLMKRSILWSRSLYTCAVRCGGHGNHGPNTLYRPYIYVTGTQPDEMRYFKLSEKRPDQAYGYQDNNHLQADTGKIAHTSPMKVKLLKDKVYAWCSCGHSHSQPFCDGNHNRQTCTKPLMKPVRFIPDKDMEVWLCQCKQSKDRPFCDGSHRVLVPPDPETLLPALVKKKKKKK